MSMGWKVDCTVFGIPFRRIQGKDKKDYTLQHGPLQKLGTGVVAVWCCTRLYRYWLSLLDG